MNKEKILEKLKPILAESLSIDLQSITPESRLKEDLGADSLDVVQTSMDIEKAFDVSFSDTEMEAIVTVGNIVDLVYGRMVVNAN